MKLLYCQDCGDIIAPWSEALRPRWCRCARHAVWWVDPSRGVLRLHDKYYPTAGSDDGPKTPRQPRAYFIGLTNLLLRHEGIIDAKDVQEMIDAHEDTYIFKRIRSLVLRCRPGESSDTAWAPLPSIT